MPGSSGLTLVACGVKLGVNPGQISCTPSWYGRARYALTSAGGLDQPDSRACREVYVPMPSVEEAIKKKYHAVISMTDMNKVNQELRRIAADPDLGLGVAILVAWQHGLKIKHIPLERYANRKAKPRQVEVVAASDDCPYVFVHVPIRRTRGNKPKLVELGIMNRNADPALFIYHEDGLIGTFSFPDPSSVRLRKEDIREILDTLFQQGVLMKANIDNRQIQFKDLAAKEHIKKSHEEVYVRVENQPLEKGRLPIELNWEDVWDYVAKALEKKSACNYCSVQAFTQNEATIHSAHVFSPSGDRKEDLATVRNYRLGFTFAPFGDPREVCHFLAWDFPHINDLVMNMEPQIYSFSDLIRLVRLINRDIRKFCSANEVDQPFEPISGICNHWAGNSIYHQHYQFLRIAGLPLMRGLKEAEPLVTYQDIQVRKFANWPSPVFFITSLRSGRDGEVMDVADRVAREWLILSEGEDLSYGNGIAIKNHTQNIFVTTDGDQLSAIFIPRERKKIDTSGPENLIQKKNAGVLEMMGYFIIDNPQDFEELKKKSLTAPEDLRKLGDSWLSELAPKAEAIEEFETNIGICLSDGVTPHEERIDEILGSAPEDLRQEVQTLASAIQHDESLDHRQREHLYRELISTILESRAGGSVQEPAE